MSLVESRGQISKAMRDLESRWGHVRESWDDAQADAFEQQYMLEFQVLVRKTVAAMDHMNVVLNKIVKDCE